MNVSRSKAVQQRSHAVIPGGCHTYAKRDDQFPEGAPAFIVKGERRPRDAYDRRSRRQTGVHPMVSRRLTLGRRCVKDST
jgi:hypothetical protein